MLGPVGVGELRSVRLGEGGLLLKDALLQHEAALCAPGPGHLAAGKPGGDRGTMAMAQRELSGRGRAAQQGHCR